MYVPVGVRVDLFMVRLLENDGRPEAGLNEHEAPAGRLLEHDTLTDWGVPLRRLTVTVLDAELPWVARIAPEFEMEKSKSVETEPGAKSTS